MTRWDKIGTTAGPTRIGGTIVPAGAELLIPIAEPDDMEGCFSCKLAFECEDYPRSDRERFRLHLERHLLPQVRYITPVDPERTP